MTSIAKPKKETAKTVICARLAQGESLRSICRSLGIAESTVRGWEVDSEEFAAQSRRAREIGCHSIADETIEIADDGSNDWMRSNKADDEGWRANGENVQRSRLRIDTRLRLLGKWLPKVYGDRLELGGTLGVKRAPTDLSDAELELIARREKKLE